MKQRKKVLEDKSIKKNVYMVMYTKVNEVADESVNHIISPQSTSNSTPKRDYEAPITIQTSLFFLSSTHSQLIQ